MEALFFWTGLIVWLAFAVAVVWLFGWEILCVGGYRAFKFHRLRVKAYKIHGRDVAWWRITLASITQIPALAFMGPKDSRYNDMYHYSIKEQYVKQTGVRV